MIDSFVQLSSYGNIIFSIVTAFSVNSNTVSILSYVAGLLVSTDPTVSPFL